MKFTFKAIMALLLTMTIGLIGCSKNDPDGGDGGNSDTSGGYGKLNGNLICIGSTRDITYTSCVLLGTVDFPKITSDHTYGIVYMEALTVENFNYDSKLIYGGKSDRYDKEDYTCVASQISSSTSDGRFEKQLVHLKPATRYYYRAYVAIGQNINYSDVEYFTTLDPSAEMTISTSDASDIFAVAGKMNGVCNVGKLQDVNEDQRYGFIYTDERRMSSAETLSYEYYLQWTINHFETEDEMVMPSQVTTQDNLNGRISCDVSGLKPGTTYWYRTFFYWNGKYFYSSDVKTLVTKGASDITVRTNDATDVTATSAVLNATVPFSQIGLQSAKGGFMLSKNYSNASEFDMTTAVKWSDKRYYPNADVYYVETTVTDKDFSESISGLDRGVYYYVVAYISLGEYDNDKGEKEEMYLYGNVMRFFTVGNNSGSGDAGDDDNNIAISSAGSYPWYQEGDYWYSGNAGVGNSDSTLTVEVKHTAGQQLSFYLQVSSETGYDYVHITAPDYSSDYYSGSYEGEVYVPLISDGKSLVKITYHKDGSGNGGNDRATVGKFKIIN